jgi:DNA-binding NarL/FixJ family response regulator
MAHDNKRVHSIMPRVLIVEDDAAFRERYVSILAADPAFQVVASVGTGLEGLAMLDKHKPDVLLVDLGLPDISGIEIIRRATATLPDCECMVVTVFGDEEHVLASIEAGASGYLLKDASEENFLSGIRELINGGSPISPVIARRLLKRFQPNAVVPDAEEAAADNTMGVVLSVRERDILVLASKGFNYPEMGKLMGLSPHTITSHVKKIYRKLAVHSRGEAVFEAKRMGLIRTL